MTAPENLDLVELISRSIDGDLTDAEDAELQRRIRSDENAVQEMRNLRETVRLTNTLSGGARLSDELFERLAAIGSPRSESYDANPADFSFSSTEPERQDVAAHQKKRRKKKKS